MKKKLILVFIMVMSLGFFWVSPAWAAKKRPPRGGRGNEPAPAVQTNTATKGAKVLVKFRADRRGLLLSFTDIDQVRAISYRLTYQTNGVLQGIQSTINLNTSAEERELLFGTCSDGVCVYHENITEARLVIDSQLSSGLTIRKPFRIKV